MGHKNDISIYLRADAREALNKLAERAGVSRQQVIVRLVLAAAAEGAK